MDALMRLGSKTFRKSCVVAGCLMLALQVGFAQNKTAGSANATRAVLFEKAHALESRGRPDMAIQIWQQILLSAPGDTDALAGLAKDPESVGRIVAQAINRAEKPAAAATAPETEADAKPDAKAEPQPDARAAPQPEAKAEPKPEAKPQPYPKAEPKPDAEAKTPPDPTPNTAK